METDKKIGIDCRMINESGIGRYIYNLIFNLTLIDKNNTYYLFVYDKESMDIFLPLNFNIVHAPYKWHSFGEQFGMLFLINSLKLDLYHSPHPNMPFFYGGKFIITIHDLTMLEQKTGRASTYFYPIYFIKWLIFKLMLGISIKKSYKVVTVSNFVKDKILKRFKVNENKVQVIYNGVPEKIHKIEDKEKTQKVLDKLRINKPFLFYVGNAYPHKNLERLIEAFKIIKNSSDLILVLAGKKDFFYERLIKEYKNIEGVIFTGELSDYELSCLYSETQAFVYPSVSEGFGIQIVEAIKCGSRLICSNNSSFPEIASDYAFYFNPYEVNDIKDVILKNMNSDISYRIKDAQERIKKFNWVDSSLKHYELYREANK